VIDLRALASALGGEICGRNTVIAPGPGHSRKDRSLSVTLDANAPDGFVCFSHAGDDWRVCRDHVRQRLGLPSWQPGDGRDRRIDPSRLEAFDRTVIDIESARRKRTDDDEKKIKRARDLWDEAADPRGTVVEKYLASRALSLDHDMARHVLRYHPRCPWRDENSGETIFVPALVAPFRSIDDDTITGIQRVALTPDGKKISRRMLGVVHRAAVKLDLADNRLAIGEGIETCLAARQLGIRPIWALGSVGAIAHFPILDGIGCLRILGEAGAASAKALRLCGNRWHAAGRKVRIIMPCDGCSDLNDEIMGQAVP
jgi:putative DNA primase/helicase